MIKQSMSQTTFSYCENCQRVNRVDLQEARAKDPICGICKAVLPIHNGINELSTSGLRALSERCPLPVVADFWASWCEPCKSFAPIFEQAAQQLSAQVVFVKINTEANPLATDFYKIRSIPTFLLLSKGVELARQSGVMPLEMFLGWLQGHTNRAAS